MVENVLRGIGGIGHFGVISISIFFAFFIGMLFWASRLKKNYLSAMQRLPLDGGETYIEKKAEIEPRTPHE